MVVSRVLVALERIDGVVLGDNLHGGCAVNGAGLQQLLANEVESAVQLVALHQLGQLVHREAAAFSSGLAAGV